MARRMEEEHPRKIARFKKMIKYLACQVIGDQEDDFQRSKTVLWSNVQVEKSKEANLGSPPTIDGRVPGKKRLEVLLEVWRIGEAFANLVGYLLAYKKPLTVFEKRQVLNVRIMCGWKSYREEYVRYHEGRSHGAHDQGGNAYRGINLSGTNFTPGRQDGVGDFSPCARSFEHANRYEENRIGAGNCITYGPFERIPRKETRNEKNYMKMDKRRRKAVGFNAWSELKCALNDKFEVGQFERLEWSQAMRNSKGKQEMYISSQGIEKQESMKPSLMEKSSIFNSLSCATPRVDDNDFHVANCVSCVLGVEDRRSMGKEPGPILEDLPISPSLNPSLCYKELMRLLNFTKKLNGSLKVFKAHPCDLVKTTFGNGVFELNLKNLVEKHLVSSIASIEFFFKDETLNESIVQKTKSYVKIENQSLGATLLYSLTFKEFLDELSFKSELKVIQVLMNGFKDESFQRRDGWYDPKSAKNYRAILRFGHKIHG
ncbi:hypothetical protein M9H77_03286 [Catharanthus roseus]|uniref:Uncharacterized protein n=1 Tax=Catharanthus roseus TaxID=4058 RepID=A0ACC0CAQ6_CATRO|nr:hypothetical protein M9H77_03286 [Catharanthus roseus]